MGEDKFFEPDRSPTTGPVNQGAKGVSADYGREVPSSEAPSSVPARGSEQKHFDN